MIQLSRDLGTNSYWRIDKEITSVIFLTYVRLRLSFHY